MIPGKLLLLSVFAAACSAVAAAASPCLPPIHLDTSGPRPTVQMTVANGHGAKAIFDTGSMGAIIDVSAADLLGLGNEGPVSPPDDRMPFPNKYRSTLKGMRLAGVALGDVTVQVMPVPPLPGIAGVLSPQIFSGRLVELDLRASELRVCSRSRASSLGPGYPYSDSPFAVPTIPVTVGGSTIAAHIDTGSPAALLFPMSYAKQFVLAGPLVKIGTATGHNGTSDIYKAKIKGEVRVGALKLTDPDAEFTDVVPRANVGSSLLHNMIVIIDPERKLSWTRVASPQGKVNKSSSTRE